MYNFFRNFTRGVQSNTISMTGRTNITLTKNTLQGKTDMLTFSMVVGESRFTKPERSPADFSKPVYS